MACFFMLSCLIFNSSVDRGIPSFTAAPVDYQTKALLTLLKRHLVALTPDHHGREVRNLLDDFFIMLSWAARLAPIDCEGAQHKIIRGQDRGRPARSETVRQRGRTPSI